MKRLICYLTANRIILFLTVFLSSGIKPFSNFILTFGRRWDGNSYTFIAEHGYVTFGPEKNFIVFPPLYPALIKIVSTLGVNSVLSGVLLSNLFFILGSLLLYKLIEIDWNKKIAVLAVVLISIFPTTYFFSVSYPESLFIFLFALSFYLARKQSYFLSSVIAGLAASTRPFGLIIFPSILLFMRSHKKLNLQNVILAGFLFALPLVPYVYINFALFGNPLEFSLFLKLNWQKSFDFPWNGILASWKRGIFTTDSATYKYFVGYAEAIASTVSWISVFLGGKKWGIKSPYFLYILLGTIFFTSTGFILSAPRYLLSIPPLFVLFAEFLSKNKIIKFSWMGISIILFLWFSHEFALGRWAF